MDLLDPFYIDRADAGRRMAERLSAYANRDNTIVLGLPRGGVPVAFEIAKSLRAPLDVFVVRKLGVPSQPELAMGAIASGGVKTLNNDIIQALRIPESVVESVERKETLELTRRETLYRGDRSPLDVDGKNAILIDDGLATGSSMRAASLALRKLTPRRLIVAVPVATVITCEELHELVDEIICPFTPEPFIAVGRWYRDFAQTTDPEVHTLLEKARAFSQRPL